MANRHVTHTDGFTLYWPTGPAPEVFHYNQPAFKALMLNFSEHMHAMSDTLVPTSYPLSMEPPLITSLECKVGKTSLTKSSFSSDRAMGEAWVQRGGWSSSLQGMFT